MSMFIRPKNGILIRDPKTNLYVLPEGKTVENNSFWRRRIKDGDVYVQDVEKEEKPKKEIKSKNN